MYLKSLDTIFAETPRNCSTVEKVWSKKFDAFINFHSPVFPIHSRDLVYLYLALVALWVKTAVHGYDTQCFTLPSLNPRISNNPTIIPSPAHFYYLALVALWVETAVHGYDAYRFTNPHENSALPTPIPQPRTIYTLPAPCSYLALVALWVEAAVHGHDANRFLAALSRHNGLFAYTAPRSELPGDVVYNTCIWHSWLHDIRGLILKTRISNSIHKDIADTTRFVASLVILSVIAFKSTHDRIVSNQCINGNNIHIFIFSTHR